MTRFVQLSVVLLALVGVACATAWSATIPAVPLPVQAQIKRQKPLLAYVPTRVGIGFHYRNWWKTPTTVRERFTNKAGREIVFVATPLRGLCRTGMEKSFQLAGNKVYWSHRATEQQAWRCVRAPRGGRIRLVASSPQPPSQFADVGLGRVVASARRI